jgi:hypothetical protein
MPTEKWMPLRIKDRVFVNVVKFEDKYTMNQENSLAFLNRLENERVSL